MTTTVLTMAALVIMGLMIISVWCVIWYAFTKAIITTSNISKE